MVFLTSITRRTYQGIDILHRGFNDAVNGFVDDGWTLLGNDGSDDVTVAVNSSPDKLLGTHANLALFSALGGGILCAKASMLLQVLVVLFKVFKKKITWYLPVDNATSF
jgi:uncharacterized protein YsxB (DUF464 family)